jgi:RHS repeat-associated protein
MTGLFADGILESFYRTDYIGDRYECKWDGTTNPARETLYLGGDAYSAPMVYIKQKNGSWTLYNIGRDYLGSITQIATTDGTPVAEYSYDPWGRLRNPQTLSIYARGNEPTLMLGRGFTGHEHLTQFGLINMNARLYDPLVGRFLSPDPFVQDADFSQNLNRYSYALNNPLKYSDESGEYALIDDCLLAVIGGFINWGVNGFKTGNGQGALYFAIGALGGLGTLYAPEAESLVLGVVSGLNSVVRQAYTTGEWNASSIDPMRVAADACLGIFTPYIGGELSSWLSNTPILTWTSNIASKALSLTLNRGLSNGLSGFILGTGLGLMATNGDWNQAWKMGLESGALGFSFGALSGFVEGYLQDQPTRQNQNENDPAATNDGNRVSDHANKRMGERSVSESSVQDAINNPLSVQPGKTTENGPSVKYIGNEATVLVNPTNGTIITVYPTSTQRRNKLLQKK